jgi:hypothetical protein
VRDTTFHSVSAGAELQFDPVDLRGTILANGLYYVVVTIDGQKSVLKLIVLR